MLILTRRIGESIIINEDITVRILGLIGYNNPKIRIGISAPDGMPVHREEIQELILAERAALEGLGVEECFTENLTNLNKNKKETNIIYKKGKLKNEQN